jgi:hypothetical protein
VEYFTVLIQSGGKQDPVETFQAKDFDDAMEKVKQMFPNKTYRLYRGKTVPERKKGDEKIPPSPPAKVKAS